MSNRQIARARSRLCALAILSLFAALRASAGEPRSTAEWEAMEAAWNRRTLIDAYRAVGSRDPKWDSLVEGGFEEFIRFVTDTTATTTPGRLLDPLAAAIRMGCDDPLVRYFYGFALQWRGQKVDAERELRAALKGLRASSYPRVRRAMAAMRYRGALAELTPNGFRENRALAKEYMDELANALANGEFREPGEERLFVEIAHRQLILWREHGDDVDELWSYLARTCAARAPEAEWPTLMIRARGLLARVANLETSAASASPAARQSLLSAREALLRAHGLRPHYPEAATDLIEVAFRGAAEGDTPREWFEKSLVAQRDYAPAYRKYATSLMPFYGGSWTAALTFAKACVDTSRFDTEIPELFWSVLTRYSVHQADPPCALFRDSEIYEYARRMFEGYLNSPHFPRRKASYRARFLAAAHCAGDVARARELFPQVAATLEVHLAADLISSNLIRELRAHYGTTAPPQQQRPEAVTVSLEFDHPEAQYVSVIGNFNEWKPARNPMRLGDDGVWRIDLSLRPNFYAYRFFVDGNELMDPMNLETMVIGGRTGSLLVVRPPVD